MAAARAPRRLTKAARREQLIEVAMPIVAEEGFGDFSLDEIARRADVARSLLYRYFPRGRRDVVLATVAHAGRELTARWITDPGLSLEQRVAANVSRIADHAFGRSDAWRIHRRARAAEQPEITQIVTSYLDTIVANISLNNLGTADPPPAARAAILALLAFGETIVDEARETGIPRGRIELIIVETLRAALASAAEGETGLTGTLGSQSAPRRRT